MSKLKLLGEMKFNNSQYEYIAIHERLDSGVIFADIIKDCGEYEYYCDCNKNFVGSLMPRQTSFATYNECFENLQTFLETVPDYDEFECIGIDVNSANIMCKYFWDLLKIDKEYKIEGLIIK